MATYKNILFTFIALFSVTISNAQELKVVSFEKTNDISTTSQLRTDANGELCALIKVSLPVKDCKFTGNIVGEPIFNTDEYWVYMTSSSKLLEIRCPGYETLVAELGKVGVESATTYRLNLSGYVNTTGSNQNSTVNGNGIGDPTGTIAGHEYVDLGLPSGTKWATCNVGASSPSDYGNYFAWGETTTRSKYTKKNSKTYKKERGNISNDAKYDAALANWGGSWHVPTFTDFEELRQKCFWTWTAHDGHNGYKVTGPNGKSIFLPAAGFRENSSLCYSEKKGTYWTSVPISRFNDTNYSYSLNFDSDYRIVTQNNRYYGLTVRPVSD